LEGNDTLSLFADLGTGVLDAMVETAALVVRQSLQQRVKTVDCFRLIGIQNKGVALLDQVEGRTNEGRYSIPVASISMFPNRAFVYWMPPVVNEILLTSNHVDSYFVCTKGLSTDDDFRFLRLWWEVRAASIGQTQTWAWFAKGGGYCTFYYDVHLVVWWEGDGRLMAANAESRGANVARTRQSSRYYFRPAAAFSRRTSQPLSARILPEGCIFGEKTVACLPRDETDDKILSLTGYLSSGIGEFLTSSFTPAADAAARTYESGVVASLPMSPQILSDEDLRATVTAAWQAVATCRAESEISTLFGCVTARNSEDLKNQYLDALRRIDERVLGNIGLRGRVDNKHASLADEALALLRLDQLGCLPISLAIGIAFGRWDVRRIRSGCFDTSLPDPFEAIPPSVPGMKTCTNFRRHV